MIELAGVAKRYDSASAPALGLIDLSVAPRLGDRVRPACRPAERARSGPVHREQIGTVFQFFDLLDDLTVTDDIRIFGRARRTA
ncbi:hypothetical protein [Streptomyces sp. B6B3]|uniref:hypothetical protein n=1 Tax=Streptomyces sp. B6B3 TaxID=3153570 RepID=UPI00325DBB59